MNLQQKENLQHWIEALRSGKFNQTTGVLKSNSDGYCCLGVICEIQNIKSYQDYTSYTFVFEDFIEDKNLIPEDHFYDMVGLDPIQLDFLVSANDNHGLSFDEIADLLVWFSAGAEI